MCASWGCRMDDKCFTHLLTRRKLLGSAAALTGGLLSAPFLAVAGGSLRKVGSPITLGEIWTDRQHQLVIALAETILPETETAGATTARVDEFVGHMLGAWFLAAERSQFLAGLDDFADGCLKANGAPFTSLSSASRTEYVASIDRAAVEARLRAASGGTAFGLLEGWRDYLDGGDSDAPVQRPNDPLRFFAVLKELTLVGYYTSEVGAGSIGFLGPVGARQGDQGPIGARIWN